MGKVTCQKVVLVLVLHSLIYVHGASTAIGRKTLADLEIRSELKRLNKPAIKTIKNEDGDIIDCVDMYKQPAFDHPLLKNHTIQLRPSIYDGENMSSSKLLEQLWHKSGSCPEGTIPIQRTRKRHLLGARSLADASAQLESAKLSFDKSLQGGEGVIDVWNPRVEVPSESTKGTMFVGRRDGFDLVSSGWLVSPSLFGDAATRLYAFWGTDNNVGCYNLKCPGFVQTSHALTLGGALRVSSYGAEQIIIAVKIFRVQGNGNWWLVVENKTLGYWPSSLFKSMAKNADYIQWEGQIYNSVPGGKHTSTEMGSGLWPERGPRKAAYFRKCLYYDENISGKTPDYWYETKVSKPKCYGISDVFPSTGGGLAFYYGGPGGPDCDA
ncbi:hypothetical protein AAC387_Pa02g0943 [Persea americana]